MLKVDYSFVVTIKLLFTENIKHLLVYGHILHNLQNYKRNVPQLKHYVTNEIIFHWKYTKT